MKNSANIPGSVVVVNKSTLEKRVISLEEMPDYPSSDWTPIGIVVIPAHHDVYKNGCCGVVSLVEMYSKAPKEGNVFIEEGMLWGNYPMSMPLLTLTPICGSLSKELNMQSNKIVDEVCIPYMPSDYFNDTVCFHDESAKYYKFTNTKFIAPSPYLTDGSRNPMYYLRDFPSSNRNCLADFNGQINTAIILKKRGIKDYTTWRPEHNEPKDYPAPSCCDMFCPMGTKQGDWYLPAMGELGYLCAKKKTIINSINEINKAYDTRYQTLCATWYWSSTVYNEENARAMCMATGQVAYSSMAYDFIYTRAFTQVKA